MAGDIGVLVECNEGKHFGAEDRASRVRPGTSARPRGQRTRPCWRFLRKARSSTGTGNAKPKRNGSSKEAPPGRVIADKGLDRFLAVPYSASFAHHAQETIDAYPAQT